MSNRPFHKIAVRAGILLGTGAIAASASIAVAQSEHASDGAAMTTDTKHAHTNNLIRATSPYLLQHAHNPVNWYEWGPEALAKAKAEDKPIFLSIGYSACHWCHVMEHECFEDDEVAAMLNQHFISIKVDREERPDIDDIYMAYTQASTGGGGWPMSVLMAPDGLPFFAGTYFPKDRFMPLLDNFQQIWRTEREKITENATQVRRYFAQWASGAETAEGVPPRSTCKEAATRIVGYFDRSLGGMGAGRSGNKFPPSMAMELLLRVHRQTGRGDLLDAVRVTLDHMARGGIYDHIGGGICRYSTDVEWLVPHFEKMLYDQALVSSIYLDAFGVTKDPLYAYTAGDIFDYVIEDLQSPEGGFYSTRDADSEGLEGKFYIWTIAQVKAVLGEEEGALFCAFYDVSETGNWFERLGHAPKGPKNILRITKPPETFAKLKGISTDQLEGKIKTWREKIKAARSQRVPPGLDDKILTGWNGLMISSMAKGARVLDQPRYATSAAKAADFVLTNLRRDGRLLRTHRGGTSHLTGYLDDYAFLIDGLINLYEATFEQKWLDEALALNGTLIKYYWDEQGGGFYFTASDGETLIARSKSPGDGAIPSGNSVAASNLLRLAILFDRKDYREKAEALFRAFGTQMTQSPSSFERLLCSLDFYHAKVKEVAVIGDPTATETRALLATVFNKFRPNKVVVHSAGATAQDAKLPLLRGKTLVNGAPAAYVCQNYTCKRPVTTTAELAKSLDSE